jgi:hypothetical protein
MLEGCRYGGHGGEYMVNVLGGHGGEYMVNIWWAWW